MRRRQIVGPSTTSVHQLKSRECSLSNEAKRAPYISRVTIFQKKNAHHVAAKKNPRFGYKSAFRVVSIGSGLRRRFFFTRGCKCATVRFIETVTREFWGW